jgi:leader peptidase (prepilin peptidase)/N-methyltransferase
MPAYHYLSAAIAAAVSVPAGWLGAMAVQRAAAVSEPPALWMIAALLLFAVWAAFIVPTPILLTLTFVLAWTLLVLGTIDLLVFRLPDVLTLPLAAAGLLLSFWFPDAEPAAHFAGAAIAFAVLYGIAIAYHGVRGREGLGLGDAKLAAAAGAWLGWRALPSLLLIACAAGFVAIGIGVLLRGKSAMREQIAFGVPLCLAFWIVWLYGVPNV